MSGIDKRDYYRLNDQIHIDYRRIGKRALTATDPAEHFDLGPRFFIMRDIYALELESADLLRGITDKNRQLGNFLQNLNKRMEILTLGISSDHDVAQSPINPEAMISEGGLSFISEDWVEPGEFIALMMVFHPSMLGLTCFAEIHHCRLVEDSVNYRLGVKFVQLDQTNERLIARHIIRRQSDERRQRLRREHRFDAD